MSKGPYAGIKVVDLTRVLAGPYCTMMLADLGATVIKVEVPVTGEDSRHIGPFIKGKSAYFTSVNRGKNSIALDLKSEADRAVFERLLSEADILIENYRGGTMEKLGYAWPGLHARYPRLIYCAVSGFGHTGPYRDKPAYDIVVQGMGGMMSLTGHPGTPPTRVGTSIGDITAGLFALSSLGAALFHRERTGEAQFVDIAMLDCQVALLENAIARTIATGNPPGPLGSRHPSITPFAAFQAADQHIIIAAGNDQLFNRLCDAIGAPADNNDGAEAVIKRVPETVPEAVARQFHFKLEQVAPIATADEFPGYDAIIFGTPTRFGSAASQMPSASTMNRRASR